MADDLDEYPDAVEGSGCITDAILAALPLPERLPALLARWEAGAMDLDELRFVLPPCWAYNGEDDTDPRWLHLWRQAAAEGRVEWDDPLPAGDRFTVYRGQPWGAMLGYAWSLDPSIAAGFAVGPALAGAPDRQAVLVGTVRRSAIVGYIAGVGESEVIVHPGAVEDIRPMPWPEAIRHAEAHRFTVSADSVFIEW